MIYPKICEKCGAKINDKKFAWNHVYGLLEHGRDPKQGAGYLNTMAAIKGRHKSFNYPESPCSNCVSIYSKMIDDAIDSYRKSHDSKR